MQNVFALLGSRAGNGSSDVTFPTALTRRPKADPPAGLYVKLAKLYCDTDRLDLASMIHFGDTRRR